MEFKDRLSQLLEKKESSQRKLALAIGVSPQSVQQWMKGIAKPNSDRLDAIAEYFNVTPAYLMFGDETPTSCELDDGTVSIPVLNVSGSCGFGSSNNPFVEMVRLIRVAKEWILSRTTNANLRKLHIISTAGDSMAPLFNDGDFVIVDTSKNEIRGDGVYVIQSCGDIFIKRVQKDIKGGLTLISDNSMYLPMHIPAEELDTVTIIGKCLMACNVKEI